MQVYKRKLLKKVFFQFFFYFQKAASSLIDHMTKLALSVATEIITISRREVASGLYTSAYSKLNVDQGITTSLQSPTSPNPYDQTN